jgi:hypothetical protein
MDKINITSSIEEDKITVNNIQEKNNKTINNMSMFIKTMDDIEKSITDKISNNIIYMKQLINNIDDNSTALRIICNNLISK